MENGLRHIWKKYSDGDREAFGEVYKSLKKEIQLYCLGLSKDQHVAEQITSDSFTKLLEQSEPAKIENPRAWLYTVCRRDLSTLWSTNQRRSEILDHVKGKFATKTESLAEKKFEMDRIDQIKSDVLSDDEQSVWNLHERGYANQEIAEQTGMAEKTVANKKSTARKKLLNAIK